jgi:hypothetical protein
MKSSKLKPLEPKKPEPRNPQPIPAQQMKKPKVTYMGIILSDIKTLFLIKDKVRTKHPDIDSWENWKGQV